MATTITDFASAVTTLGQHLQLRRQALGLSQQALAAGICAQSLVDRIEQGQDVPNAVLLAQLCERLNLPLVCALKENYPIRRLPTFSRRVHHLYNRQRFADLVAYMDNPERLRVLKTDEDLKTYYYYYGCATYQATHDAVAALRSVHTALTMMMPQRPLRYRTLEVLLIAMENDIGVALMPQANFAGFERAVRIIREDRLVDVSENLCMVFYQYARACLHLGYPERALPILLEGIDWAVAHQSHYLLADDYYLLAQIYAGLQQPTVSPAARQTAVALAETFKQVVYQGE